MEVLSVAVPKPLEAVSMEPAVPLAARLGAVV
jgi:hypothetical protein